MKFENKVVIITGASAGIGAATAVLFAKGGAKVVLVGRNEDRLQHVSEECRANGAEHLVIKADLAKAEEARTVIDETVKKFNKIDLLVNNAGMLREVGLLEENFLETFDEVMTTNLRSVVVLTHFAAPHLIESKGNIVNISSIGGTHMAALKFVGYCTSKAALDHFTKCTAQELAEYGVRVNVVIPGPTRTEVFRTGGTSYDVDSFKHVTPLRRISEPEEVADLILFLASVNGKSVTGSKYFIHNGLI